MQSEIKILPVVNSEEYKKWIEALLVKEWGSKIIISRGNIHDGTELEGFVALYKNSLKGLVTFKIFEKELELITLNAVIPNIGIGTQLLNHVIRHARENSCNRICLITTNDNLDAMRFYMRHNFSMNKIHFNALEKSRKIKPSIPLIGFYNLPIMDEIEFEMLL